MFRPGQIMIFNSDLHHICPHLHSEANAQLSYSVIFRTNVIFIFKSNTDKGRVAQEPILFTSNF